MLTHKPLKVYRRRARIADCSLLEAAARPDDAREVAAVAGVGVEVAALFALRASEIAWSVFVGRELACIYGLSMENVLAGGRQPWLLGTVMVDRHAREFARRSRPELSRLVAKYGALENQVDARSLRTIAWLRWIGFTIYEPAPYGVDGLPFHRFRIEPPSCASPP